MMTPTHVTLTHSFIYSKSRHTKYILCWLETYQSDRIS